ncbi:hypothetical protein ACF1BQ_036660 [Bradyrhizobium sp. RDT10]
MERALGGANVPFSPIVGPCDSIKPGSIPLFKVHGSVDRRDEPLILSLRQEGYFMSGRKPRFGDYAAESISMSWVTRVGISIFARCCSTRIMRGFTGSNCLPRTVRSIRTR